jgi:RNA polymerase sigma-70 factor (ECF subfamily)
MTSLVLQARQNNSDAFAELYAMTYNKVYNYTRHYLRDDFLAQDAMQEVYILALKNISQLNDPTLFIAWLNRICFHVCFDISKKLKASASQSMEPETLDTLEDDHPYANPEANAEYNDEHRRLAEALEQLPFHERQVIVMRFYNYMKLEEIAAACEISRSTVKRYLSQGQERLSKILG